MKLLVRCLFLLVALLLLLGLAAFDPWAQTQFARMWLKQQPGVIGRIGAVDAGWSQVELKDLQLQFEKAVFSAPTVSVTAPIISVLKQRPAVRQLVARGWTLDMGRRPAPRGRPADGGHVVAPELTLPWLARQGLMAIRELLTGAGFPRDVSLAGLELEGDIRLPAPPGAEARWLHVVLQGGGLVAGQDAVFTLRVADFGDPIKDAPELRLLVRLDAASRFERIRLERAVGTDAQLAFAASMSRPANEENYALELTRAGRPLLQFDTRRSVSAANYAGTWRIDARDDDLAALLPAAPALDLLNGGGSFTADRALAQLRLSGALAALEGDSVAPTLGRLSLATKFDLALDGTVLRLTQFNGSVTGTGPVATIALHQPIDFDTSRRRFTAPNPAADWLQVSLRGLPLALFPRLPAPWVLGGGDVTGELVVRGEGEVVTLRTLSPLAAAGAVLGRNGQAWGDNLDLSLGLQATWTPTSWQIEASPLAIASQGRALARWTGRVTRSGAAKGRVTLTGKGEADMDGLATQPIGRAIGRLPGRTLTGEFTAQLGASPSLNGKITGVGRVPGRTFAADVSVETDDQGRLSFLVPAKVAFGSKVTDLMADGTWTAGSAPRFALTLTGTKVELEHLRPFGGPLAWLVGSSAQRPVDRVTLSLPGTASYPAAAWGEVPGTIRLKLENLRVNETDYVDVGGQFTFERGALRLEGGHGRLPPHDTAKLDGVIRFDSASSQPYRLEATTVLPDVSAGRLVRPTNRAQLPVWEGNFTTTVKSTGSAGSLGELWRRRLDEYRLASDAGTIRLLDTQIGDALPRKESRTNETLARLGDAVGEVLKPKREDDIDSVPNVVSREAEDVLNLIYRLRAIPYSALAVTAFRTADGTIHLNHIDIEGSRERLTGTGQIAAGQGGLAAGPLRLDLKLAVRQEAAYALADSGLLTDEIDTKGYTRFAEPIHLEGSLDQIDDSQWRERLVRAARRGAAPR